MRTNQNEIAERLHRIERRLRRTQLMLVSVIACAGVGAALGMHSGLPSSMQTNRFDLTAETGVLRGSLFINEHDDACLTLCDRDGFPKAGFCVSADGSPTAWGFELTTPNAPRQTQLLSTTIGSTASDLADAATVNGVDVRTKSIDRIVRTRADQPHAVVRYAFELTNTHDRSVHGTIVVNAVDHTGRVITSSPEWIRIEENGTLMIKGEIDLKPGDESNLAGVTVTTPNAMWR